MVPIRFVISRDPAFIQAPSLFDGRGFRMPQYLPAGVDPGSGTSRSTHRHSTRKLTLRAAVAVAVVQSAPTTGSQGRVWPMRRVLL